MKKSEALFGLARIPLDALAVTAALLLSYRLRAANIDLLPGVQLLQTSHTLPTLPYFLKFFVLPWVLLFLALEASLQLFTLRSTMGGWAEAMRVILAAILWIITVTAWYFLILGQLFFSRILLVQSFSFIIVFVLSVHASLILLQRGLLRQGIGRLLVLSVGAQPLTIHAKETLEHDIHYSYLGHLPNLDALKRILFQRPVDLVLQTDPNPEGEDTSALINYCRSHHIGYGFLPPVLAEVPHMLSVERLGLLPLMRFQPTPLDGWGKVIKRLFDLVVSALLMVILSPLLLAVSIGILIDGGWPILYVSTRTGEQGRRQIRLFKFRSMVRNADEAKQRLLRQNVRNDGPLFKIPNDPRVTRFGRFLRRWTLDELPQLANVFLGHMSLVGPRPHLPQEVDRYSLEQRRVFAIKPGMTGLAQVSGRSNLTFVEEVRLDLQYIEEWSLMLDLWILWRTIFTVLSRKGAD